MPNNDSFTLKNSNEITRKLTLLLKQNNLITVSFNEGKLFFISTLIAIDLKKRRIHFDSSSDEKINQQLINSNSILFETQLAGVHVSFTVPKISRPLLGKSTELTLEFPTELIWLERRLFYRVKAPAQNTPTCQFIINTTDSLTGNTSHCLNFEIHDISLTGFSFIYVPKKFNTNILIGIQTINNCIITLPNINSFTLDVEIRNHHPLKTSGSQKVQLIGLIFPPLTSAYESQIQRYLLSIERSRV